ncbi:hypothetical protein S83_045369 [Arachis hypogaea]
MSSVVSSLNCFICVQFSISEFMTVLCFLHILCMSIVKRKGVNEHTCGLKELMNYGKAQIKGVLKKGGNANICRVILSFEHLQFLFPNSILQGAGSVNFEI